MATSARVRASNPLHTIQSADRAARAWFAQTTPSMSLADWRDWALLAHDQEPDESTRREWNHAFAAGVGAQIALGGARHA